MGRRPNVPVTACRDSVLYLAARCLQEHLARKSVMDGWMDKWMYGWMDRRSVIRSVYRQLNVSQEGNIVMKVTEMTSAPHFNHSEKKRKAPWRGKRGQHGQEIFYKEAKNKIPYLWCTGSIPPYVSVLKSMLWRCLLFLAEAHYSLSSLMPTSSEQNVLRNIWFSSVFSCNWVNTEGHCYKCSAAINKRVLPCRGQLQCSIYNKQKTKLR